MLADLGVEQDPVGVITHEPGGTIEPPDQPRVAACERQRRRPVEGREDRGDAGRVGGIEVEQEPAVAGGVAAAAGHPCGVELIEQVQRQAAEQPRAAVERLHRVGEGGDVPVEGGEPAR